jgi:hypothetical protein
MRTEVCVCLDLLGATGWVRNRSKLAKRALRAHRRALSRQQADKDGPCATTACVVMHCILKQLWVLSYFQLVMKIFWSFHCRPSIDSSCYPSYIRIVRNINMNAFVCWFVFRFLFAIDVFVMQYDIIDFRLKDRLSEGSHTIDSSQLLIFLAIITS